MNLKRVKTTVAAGILAASMILPNMTAFAATGATDSLIDGANTGLITKEIVSPDGVSYTDDTFTFTFAQRDKGTDSGVTANESTVAIPDATITASSSTTETTTNVNDKTAKTWKQTVTSGIDLGNFTTPGVYTYDVTETSNTNSSKTTESWTYDNTAYVLRVYVTKDGDGNLVKKVTIADANGDKQTTAKFTNKMTKSSSFTLKKTATDGDGLEPADQTYTFTVTIAGNSMTEDASYQYSIEGGAAVAFTSGSTITLKSGQTATFTGVPAGSYVTVAESTDIANVDYTQTTITTTNTDNAGTSAAGTTTIENVLVKESDTAVTGIEFSNTWRNLTITGVVTNIAPYVTLVVVAVAAIAAYVAMKRRIAR